LSIKDVGSPLESTTSSTTSYSQPSTLRTSTSSTIKQGPYNNRETKCNSLASSLLSLLPSLEPSQLQVTILQHQPHRYVIHPPVIELPSTNHSMRTGFLRYFLFSFIRTNHPSSRRCSMSFTQTLKILMTA
jgi:hypothetical protein